MSPIVNGVSVLEAITRIFSRNGVPPRIVIDPNAGPSFNPRSMVVTLPGLLTEDLDERKLSQLRAFFWHESAGEVGLNDYHADPRIQGNAQRHLLANGVGDGYLDLSILADRPGAGIDIRTQVQIDCQDLLAKGATVEPTVSIVACVGRYLVEGVTTWPEVRAALPKCGELLDYVEPHLAVRPVLANGQDVIDLTLKLDQALNDYRNSRPLPKPQDPDQERGPAPQPGEPTTPGQGANNPDISLEPGHAPGDQDDQGTPGAPGGDQDDQDDQDGQEAGDQGDDQGDDQDQGDQEGTQGGDQDDDQDDDQDGQGGSQGGQGQDDGQEGGQEAPGGNNGSTQGSGPGGKGQGGGRGPGAPTGHHDKPLRDLDLGEAHDQRMLDRLTEMLLGQPQGGSTTQYARTFSETRRLVIDGKHLDAYLDKHHARAPYAPSSVLRFEASVLLGRLRAALQGPSISQERGQEYGRLDSRRLAQAMAGNRNVFIRRREVMGDSVAVAVAWDESGSMSGSKIHAVRHLVGCLSLALGQMPNVATEFTGWTTGAVAEEVPNAQDDWSLVDTPAHTAGTDATHRIYKAFSEPAAVLGPRLRLIDDRDGTPMVEGFGFSARRLAARQEDRKVLFFLTDGDATDDDINPNAPWGYNALQYEVDRANAQGITTVVFGIGLDDSDAESAMLANAEGKSDAERARIMDVVTRSQSRKRDRLLAQWGPNARLLALPEDDTITAKVTQALVSILAKQTRRRAG